MLEVKAFKTKEIKPYKNNPRSNENAVEPVMNSIKEFGFKVPIVIDKNNVVVAGHTRLKAAALGQQRHDFDGTKIVTRKIDGKGKKIILSKLVCHNGIEWCKYQRYMDKKGF